MEMQPLTAELNVPEELSSVELPWPWPVLLRERERVGRAGGGGDFACKGKEGVEGVGTVGSVAAAAGAAGSAASEGRIAEVSVGGPIGGNTTVKCRWNVAPGKPGKSDMAGGKGLLGVTGKGRRQRKREDAGGHRRTWEDMGGHGGTWEDMGGHGRT